MEFKSLKNIETSFKQIRLFGIVFVCLCAGIVGYALWNSYSFAEKYSQAKRSRKIFASNPLGLELSKTLRSRKYFCI